jgi:hypothetical protein
MIYYVKNKLTRETQSTDINKIATRNAYMSSIGFDFLRKYPNGKWVTGYVPLDENNPTEEEKLLLEEKRELEKILMKSLDENDSDNEFLLTFQIPKYNPDGSLPVFDSDNPLDLFTIRAALANGSIAPNKEEVGKGVFAKTLFYFESKEKETGKKKLMNQLRNKAGAILEKYADMREWLLCMAFKLGISIKPTHENDTLYNAITEKKESLGTEDTLQDFIKKLSTPINELEKVFIVKQGISEKVVKYDKDGLEYTFTGVRVGKTVEDSITFFTSEQGDELYNNLKQKVYKIYNVS